ncbi:hypothetical protein NEAUS06_1813 [Nematocida ausubeli]|nr:hypothetical protein NEAUS06_1813 [Nematocida ausubeli]
MEEKTTRVPSRAFTSLLRFSSSIGLLGSKYHYGFISDLGSTQQDREQIKGFVKALEQEHTPYVIVKKCMVYLDRERLREIRRMGRKHPEHALRVCRAALDHLIPRWSVSLKTLFLSALHRMEDNVEHIQLAVEVSEALEHALDTPTQEYLDRYIASRCTHSIILQAIRSMLEHTKYTKYLSSLLSICYSSSEGKEYFLSLLQMRTASSTLLYIHTVHALFKKNVFHRLNAQSALQSRITDIIACEMHLLTEKRKYRADSSTKKIKIESTGMYSNSHSRVLASALHFLEVAFRCGWLSSAQIKATIPLLFALFKKSQKIKALRTLSYTAQHMNKEDAAVLSSAGMSYISSILEKEKKENIQKDISSVVVLYNISTPENIQLLGMSGIYRLLEMKEISNQKLTAIIGRACQNKYMCLQLFEELINKHESSLAIIKAFAHAKIQLSDEMLSSYVDMVQSQGGPGWIVTEHSSKYIIEILPEDQKEELACHMLQWASALLSRSENCIYICHIIAECAAHVSSSSALHAALTSLYAQFGEKSDCAPFFRACHAIFCRLIALGQLSTDSSVISVFVFKLPCWIRELETALLPRIYKLARCLHAHTRGWIEWDNTFFSVLERLPAYAPGKKTAEFYLMESLCYYRNIDRATKIIDRYTASPNAARCAYRALQAFSAGGFMKEVLSYLIKRYTEEKTEKKAAIVKLIVSSVKGTTKKTDHSVNSLLVAVPVLEDALKSGNTSGKKNALVLSALLIQKSAGSMIGYKMAVHILNCVFPLILNKKTQKEFLVVLAAATKSLSVEFVASYLTPGLAHPDKRVRSAYQKPYIHVKNSILYVPLLGIPDPMEIPDFLSTCIISHRKFTKNF